MRTRWLLIILALFLPMAAMADSVAILWDPATGATAYDVQRATVFAGPWTVIGSPTSAAACTGTPVSCSYTDATAPGTGTVFYRLAPKNASGTLPITRAGMWYCGDCPGLPSMPKSVGVTLP